MGFTHQTTSDVCNQYIVLSIYIRFMCCSCYADAHILLVLFILSKFTMDSSNRSCLLCLTQENEVFGQKLESVFATKNDDIVLEALDNVFGLKVSI